MNETSQTISIAKPLQRGLLCPKCGCAHFEVIYTRRAVGGKLLRRRECRYCGKRITTAETRLS